MASGLLLRALKLFDKERGNIPMYNNLRERTAVAKDAGLGRGTRARTWIEGESVSPAKKSEEDENVGDLVGLTEESDSEHMENRAAPWRST